MKGFKASWLWEIRLMLSNWWHRDSYYNPLSQNSEHGLPTERRDGEVDWSEVTRQDQIIDQDRKAVGEGWNGGIQKWCLRTGVWRRGDTVTRVSGEGVLHDSNPVLLSGFRDERGKLILKRKRAGWTNCSTLRAELWVSSTCDGATGLVTQWDLTVGDLREGTFGADLPPWLSMFHLMFRTRGGGTF